MDAIVSGFIEIGAIAVDHNGSDSPPLAVSFCKVKEDAQILAASGDQTMKPWDVEANKCIGVLMGHTGSVKSMCSHPTDADIFVSGSRDGSFRLWDMRCNSTSKSRRGELRIDSTAVVKRAHLSSQAKRVRSAKVLLPQFFISDQISIATAGAADSIVKFWDSRNLKSLVTQACPRPQATDKERLHGISSLSQDHSGLFISASCMDNTFAPLIASFPFLNRLGTFVKVKQDFFLNFFFGVYLYSVLQLEKGPLRSFSGCRIESFFVKSAISPDATHTFCHPEVGKLATSSDDFTVRIWNKSSYFSNTRLPSSIRRSVMAMPGTECRKLLMNDEAMCPKPITPPKTRTPECHKKQFSSCSDQSESSEKTPESTLKSPSSVLDPPSTLKRTIRDYFLAVS
ncbi:hypothetical protein L6164_005085 [Bauhinia variegata]|uniref:Uncharacterized protein n=1 Tax=Bauhinia variegata TaxID=167791 RepID=A0ACB9PQ65_BAUVA|nr:hypothetical protein L6164_005085 [Bauhinia variegata]